MRRVLGLVLVAWFAAVACSINTQPSGTGSSADASAGGTGGGTGVDSGTGGSSCFPTPKQKYCGANQCVAKDDPASGCADPSCAACALPNAVNDCENGKCGIQSCNPGFDNCDNDPSNGCETNTASDPHNCGACGKDCFAGGGTTNWNCNQGKCEVSNCPTGQGDCNNDSTDGCEVNLTSDPKNCSFCGNDCSSTVQHATAVCTNSKCDYSKCDAGWADCDGNRANGCEQDIGTDPTNCGSCGNVCPATNGAAGCVAGKCTIACKPGYADCDPTKPGCETAVTTTTNCGTCGNKCSTNNSNPTCSGGQCHVGCKAGFQDCNGKESDGCEANMTSPTTCGSCTKNCTTSVKNATAICDKGSCSYSGACTSGWGDCDTNKANGCETSLDATSHCGACGTNCTTSVKNATPTCSSGTCDYTGSCNTGWADCNNNRSDGCEKDVSSDANNCGGCGTKCSATVVNASGVACQSSQCTYTGNCNNGWADCDSNKANGCEVDTSLPASCGSCTNDCTKTVLHVATVTCAGGNTCSYSGSCDAGWGDCNANKADGCEQALNTDSYCGDCNTTCNGNKHCACSSPGSCVCQ